MIRTNQVAFRARFRGSVDSGRAIWSIDQTNPRQTGCSAPTIALERYQSAPGGQRVSAGPTKEHQLRLGRIDHRATRSSNWGVPAGAAGLPRFQLTSI